MSQFRKMIYLLIMWTYS